MPIINDCLIFCFRINHSRCIVIYLLSIKETYRIAHTNVQYPPALHDKKSDDCITFANIDKRSQIVGNLPRNKREACNKSFSRQQNYLLDCFCIKRWIRFHTCFLLIYLRYVQYKGNVML